MIVGYIKKFMIKLVIFFKEKKYKKLKYLLFKKKSKYLLVVFSAFPGIGNKPSYNYLHSFSGINVNRLYILDNVNNIGGGSYYLGENGDFYMPQQICELIQYIKKYTNSKKLILAGTSKGGTSALYYSSLLNADNCVIGAPQYYIGDYLDNIKHKRILEELCGNNPLYNVDYLNRLLSDIVEDRRPDTVVYLQYSHLEETFHSQIEGLIFDLKQNGVNLVLEDQGYLEHNDVAKYYPQFAKKIIKDIITG